jgi:signal transduction histidine kinase
MIRSLLASLRFRLLLLVVLSVLPAFALAIYDVRDQYRREADVAKARALEVARAVSAEHDDLITGAQQLLITLAEFPQVRGFDTGGCSRLFAHLLAKYTQYLNLAATTPDGDIFCSAVPVQGSVSAADTPWFQDAIRTQRFAVGNFQIGRVTGRPSLLFALPVMGPAGNVLAVTYAALDLAWLNRRVAAARPPQEATVTILDRNGRILARYPGPERWLGQPMPEPFAQTILAQHEGTAEGPGLDGVAQLYAFTPFGRGGESGAHVSVAIPAAHVFADVRRQFTRHALGLTLAAAALLIAAGVSGQVFLLRPIRTLLDATRRLGRGELTARTGLAGSAGELGELARHFDAMAEALEQRAKDSERAEAALYARTEQLEAVRDTTTEITRELKLTTLLHLVAQRACELTGATAADIDLWDPERQLLVPEASYGHTAPRPKATRHLGEGAMGTVARERRGMIINDYRTSPMAHPDTLAHTTITASLVEPLLYHDQLLGVIGVDHETPGRTFTERDQATLRLFAAQATIAIENARLFGAVEQTAREARSLYEVAHRLTTSLNAAEVLQLIAVKTTDLLRTPHAQVVLWDETRARLRLGAAYGTQVERVKDQEFRLGFGLNGIVAETRVSLIVNDYQTWPHRVPELTELVAVIGVPLLYRGRLLGILTTHATTPGSTFTERHLALLTTFADQAAVAMENARLYEVLRVAAAELEARVTARTRELADVNRQLQTVSQHKSEFLANMSHELRTPLNSILGFAQLLLEQSADVFSAKRRRFLSHIYNSGQHLLELINDILDLSKAEAGKLVLQPESVVAPKLVEETLVIVRGLADKKQLRIDANFPKDLPRLVADPVRLKQIFLNLLSNAVKFTPEGGQVTVTVQPIHGAENAPNGTPSDGFGEWLEVRVADTGVGITEEDMPRLFKDFVQLEATATKRHEGTGLGLALTKRLVALHGGRIWAESAGRDRGACFVVRLPLLEVPAPRILVVDDEAPFRRLLGMILHEAGYRVAAAPDAPEAIRALEADPPDLVVLDVGLPPDGAGGWRVLTHLRATERLRAVPVLVLTGQDQIHAAEALARGASDFLGKPVSPQILEETVARLLKHGRPLATVQEPADGSGD